MGISRNSIFKINLLILLILSISFLVASSSTSALTNASLKFDNNTLIDFLRYDKENSVAGSNEFGSDSYMDSSPTNANLFLDVCHPNLTVNQKIDLVYASENLSLTSSLLNYLPLVTEVTNYSDGNGSYNCSFVDFDLSSTRALYPGYIYPVIVPINSSYTNTGNNILDAILLSRLTQFLNGSFEIGINVVGPPKEYRISPTAAFDENGLEITRNGPYLITSLLNATNDTLSEGIVPLGDYITHYETFEGSETVYVNGILSLEIEVYDPCAEINSSGYYIMNDTGDPVDTQNLNGTCIVIQNVSNIAINFGQESIDGDGEDNGSMTEDLCAIIVEDSVNVTFEDLKVYEFYYGLCVINSTVNIFGTADSYNFKGAMVDENSEVNFIDTIFQNNDTEIIVSNNSLLNLIDVEFQLEDLPERTVYIDSEMKDVRINGVSSKPDLPNITDPNNKTILDIGQFIELNNMSNDSYASLRFHYEEYANVNVTPKAATDNMSIYEYNGTFNESNVFNGSDGWSNGSWVAVDTVIFPAQQLIESRELIYNFSVFAPMGFETNNTNPDPEPEPKPRPDDGGGDSGGAGAFPASPEEDIIAPSYPDSLILELEIPDNITLMQGEAGDVEFNLSNVGDGTAFDLTISPSVLYNWDYTNYSIDILGPGQNESGAFQIASYEKTVPGAYFVTVHVYSDYENETYTLVSKLLKVFVKPRGNLSRLKILEYPPDIMASPFSTFDISFLVQNIGDLDIKNATIKLEPSDCLLNVQGSHDIDAREIKSIDYIFSFGDEGECKYNLKFYNSEDKLVGFLPVKFIIKPKSWLDEPVKASILITLILIWTVLTTYIITRKRKFIRK